MSFYRNHHRIILVSLILAGCATKPSTTTSNKTTVPNTTTARADMAKKPYYIPGKKGGGYYKDDGPGELIPGNLDEIPNAIPRYEPLHRFANNPYTVLGQTFTPATNIQPYRSSGIGSWYGRKFHGQRTSSGEVYDMFGMTAAHPTLPIPSYVRVTNPATNRTVIVRVNDRGPFLHDRLIDLSYTAAYKLGYADQGSAAIEVEQILPPDYTRHQTPLAVAAPNMPSLKVSATTAPAVIRVSAPINSSNGSNSSNDVTAISRPLYRAEYRNNNATTAAPAVVKVSDSPPSIRVTTPPIVSANRGSGHYLQLAAFSSQDNADTFLNRIRSDLGSFASSAHVHAQGGLFRVQVGPYQNRENAQVAANKIRGDLNINPMIMAR